MKHTTINKYVRLFFFVVLDSYLSFTHPIYKKFAFCLQDKRILTPDLSPLWKEYLELL